MDEDIRWKQRFYNFLKAFEKLELSMQLIQENIKLNESTLQEMIKEGLIQRFEYTHELAWNVMKDYAEYQGNNTIGGSRDATREAFNLKLILNGEIWMDMIGSRNKTSHTYNEDTVNEIYNKIILQYFNEFYEFKTIMTSKL